MILFVVPKDLITEIETIAIPLSPCHNDAKLTRRMDGGDIRAEINCTSSSSTFNGKQRKRKRKIKGMFVKALDFWTISKGPKNLSQN
jgi:hypothetical protein